MTRSRISDIQQFYALLDHLCEKCGGPRRLSECTGKLAWARRGVYFFFEDGEERTDTGAGARVVRIGTHALKSASATSLWGRLSQHRGQTASGSGNHRGSIFRLIVGTSLKAKYSYDFPSWGMGSNATPEIKVAEIELEMEVSRILGAMRVLWIDVGDEPGPTSLRGVVERNSIALLSNFHQETLDPPSGTWLGNFCDRERVRRSGLWNSNHVDESYDPAFLGQLETLIEKIEVKR